MVKKVFVCAECQKNTRDDSIEMWVYCHKHFKGFIKRKQFETAKQIFKELEQPNFFYTINNPDTYPEIRFNHEIYNEIKARFLQEIEK